jgi:UDP-N-acetylmuramoylalanine--D-glutamate ligase
MTKVTNHVDLSAMQRVTDTLLAARKNNLKAVLEIAHRLETVAEANGVTYINDSKATNIHATLYSLECLTGPIVWLVSASDFRQDYEALNELVQAKVKAIICLTEPGVRCDFNFEFFKKPLKNVANLEGALPLLNEMLNSGDSVLFSPAHPSELRYDSFKERGDHFKNLVQSLTT